jgi:mRNA interferase MazF
MAFRRGVIYLANFNPSKGTEAGKIRPALIIQSDFLNGVGHPSTTVLPLTTRLLDEAQPLRFRVIARQRLEKDSDVMIDQIRTIDNRRLIDGVLAELRNDELAVVEEYLAIVLGLDPLQSG